MLLKACPRCGVLIQYGGTYCQECRVVVEEEQAKRRQESIKRSNRKYNRTRDPKYIRFYNSKEWRVLSMTYTQDKAFRCEQCGQVASEVHHVVPIQTDDGWNRRLDYDNLELLCKSCHNDRHNRFKASKSHSKAF